jgi:YbbR domain-containing protein
MVLAVTLFVLVRNDKDATSGAYVKIIYTTPEDKVLVSDPVPEIKVSVRGPWTKLQHIDRSLEPIRIDLNNVRVPPDGNMRIDEDAIKLPQGVRVSSIVPSEVHVQFEPRVVRDVPVQPILEGQPADGYRVAKVAAEPARVRVDGAKGEVALESPPAHTHLADATAVSVQVDVRPAMVERTFDQLPIRVVGLTHLEATLDPPTARLVIRGPSPLVGDVSDKTVSLKIDAALIDTRPPAKYIRTLTVSGLPAGVAAEVQPDTIMLTTHRKHE